VSAPEPAEKCLLSFPPHTPLDRPCPRCKGPAGDHPAPSSLLADQEASIFNRPTLREALA
jgi:hypothetical protein